MHQIVFFFCGNGDSGIKSAPEIDEACHFKKNVIRIYLKGPHHKKIGNGYIWPNIDLIATTIKNAFNQQTLDLNRLLRTLGDGVCLQEVPADLPNPLSITRIALHGFSRGGMVVFAVAKALNDLNIPMDLIANQPVPGDPIDGLGESYYTKYHDLRSCQNIHSATTFLACYTIENGLLHNKYLKQMVAKFHPTTLVNNWIMPHQNHSAWVESNLIIFHIQILFEKSGYAVKYYTSLDITQAYQKKDTLYFTPKKLFHEILGHDGTVVITKDPVYLQLKLDKAVLILKDKDLPFEELSNDKASAVVALAQMGLGNNLKAMLEFILKDGLKAAFLVNTINEIYDLCEYLVHATRQKDNNFKSEQLAKFSSVYQQTIVMAAYDYLQIEHPSKGEKRKYSNLITQAEADFENEATSIDRNIKRKFMYITANGTSHLCGLFVLINSLNCMITGNYFFFNQTRSTMRIKEATADQLTILSQTL